MIHKAPHTWRFSAISIVEVATMKVVFLILMMIAATAWGATPAPVLVLNIDGVIGPATSDYVSRAMEKSESEKFQLVVIELDTPGGLDATMRTIVRKVLSSPVPVAVYVTPSGARAASAGTYILYSAHVAAMAPGTNLGAATPVQVAGFGESKAMMHKMTNDAAAYIHSLAELRGRNADWAVSAVRQAESIPANQALKLHVIDYIEPSLQSLLNDLDGKTISTSGGSEVLSLKGAHIVRFNAGWRDSLLSAITDPNIAYVLMVIGFYGLIFELANPGFGLPGVAGAICLLLALFAFQSLPVNYVGLALILLAIVFFATEAVVPSYGSLGFGGVIAFVLGSILMMNGTGGLAIAWPIILTATAISTILVFGIVRMAFKARNSKIVSGAEGMIGTCAEALEDFDASGRVLVHGEIWNARTLHPVIQGEILRVSKIEGLTVIVDGNGD